MINNTNNPKNILEIIKVVHTLVWLLMTFSVAYVFYCGVVGEANIYTWIAILMIFLEGLALILGKGDCPLHVYAQKVTGKNILNDTYLPSWIFFKGYKVIMSIVFIVGLVLIVIKNANFG